MNEGADDGGWVDNLVNWWNSPGITSGFRDNQIDWALNHEELAKSAFEEGIISESRYEMELYRASDYLQEALRLPSTNGDLALTGLQVLGTLSILRASSVAKVSPGLAGRMGEGWARQIAEMGDKVKIIINNRVRIPDGINFANRTLTEIKNVKKLSFTRQLRDYADYAKQNGMTFNLYVRHNTQMTKPLLKAADDGLVNIHTLR